jgi:NADH-quinone oxidoreductase subunit N
MLAGVTVLVSTTDPSIQAAAIGGILFYLAAYGIMNSGAFGVLMLLPSRHSGVPEVLEPAAPDLAPATTPTGTSAETFDDIAGKGRTYPAIGLAMAICCWSLTGLPLTVGFFGKFYLILPMLAASHKNPEISHRMFWLMIFLLINAAISAAYYLRIIAAMFLRAEPAPLPAPRGRLAKGSSGASPVATTVGRPWPVMVGVALSVLATLAFGIFLPATDTLSQRAQAAQIEPSPVLAPPQIEMHDVVSAQ